jgi:hypothetical protein
LVAREEEHVAHRHSLLRADVPLDRVRLLDDAGFPLP